MGNGGRLRSLVSRPDRLVAVRRRVAEVVDEAAARAWHRLGPSLPAGDAPGMALITVNFSTTRFLKLMLCTLAEQTAVGSLTDIVVVDNGSRDGGLPFLRRLASEVPRLLVVERRRWLNHAAGMRAGLKALDGAGREPKPKTVVFCDTDVVFRRPDALSSLTEAMQREGAVLAGEFRDKVPGRNPNIQASFFTVDRQVLRRRDVVPVINHGAPALKMQASILAAGLEILDFPSNHGGWILHRGRSGVAAGIEHRYRSWDGAVTNTEPHFMGLPEGERIWGEIESRWAPLLTPTAEPALIEHLAGRLGGPFSPPAAGLLPEEP